MRKSPALAKFMDYSCESFEAILLLGDDAKMLVHQTLLDTYYQFKLQEPFVDLLDLGLHDLALRRDHVQVVWAVSFDGHAFS